MRFLAKAAQGYATVLVTTEPMTGIPISTALDCRLPFDEWYDAVLRRVGSSQHLTGGNPMLAQEAGGVANNERLVYGTINVRVVDGSVFPYQPSARPMGLA
ncbi:uncharacterized protein JN550_006977 [Neoarthrinium moseri]|uniref:uncharacterized protein n=1 Tax=Neoarthrinium moseri TaxID=1658444 RepID=UPI001FDBE60C|nr:uncharacterized protein JN550_006977 [Neoarthrinium moseri]KAI1867836.1 hypothetical protein JN550_006977 [Neoarthrinium moseri]